MFKSGKKDLVIALVGFTLGTVISMLYGVVTAIVIAALVGGIYGWIEHRPNKPSQLDS